MKKIRPISLLLLIALAIPMFAFGVSADAEWADFLNFDGVDEPMPEKNLLKWGSMDDESSVAKWTAQTSKVDHVSTSSGGYLFFHDIPHATAYVDYSHKESVIGAGIYKFTGYFRTAYEGEVTALRFYVFDNDVTHKHGTREGAALTYIYPTSDEWLKVEFYVTLDNDFTGFRINGGTHPDFFQSYCIDNFSLVKVDSMPEGYTRPTSFGTAVTVEQSTASNNGSATSTVAFDPELEKQYDVQGIVYNRDIDFIGTCSASTTKKDIENFVYGYKDTHITDYMINIFCQIAAYPSDVVSDFIDKYHYQKDNNVASPDGRAINTYKLFEEKKIDYIDIFCKKFPEIGINPWLSYRMNDAHGVSTPDGVTAWEFFTENPQYRRVQHGSTSNRYYDNLFDFTYEAVRQNMLSVINESLDRYDCYGIELDFQREIWLWHTGGEYNGLDILNDYMREIQDVVNVYEEKYGHEIKIAVRVASDIQTNYDLGLDVITWAAEGIIDLVNPTARWATTDLDVPARMWGALMHPYGVEVAPGIEWCIQTYAGRERSGFTMDKFAATCANWFSQGADKIYLYNQFIGLPGIKDTDRVVGSGNHFDMLTTIGSYEKVVNHKRQMLLSYNDISPMWKPIEYVLPFRVNANTTGAVRIPIGKVPEGATVTLRMAANSLNLKNLPTVYINGKLATHLENIVESNPYTSDKLMVYAVPESALDEMHLVVEVTPQKYFSSTYIDVIIEPVEK